MRTASALFFFNGLKFIDAQFRALAHNALKAFSYADRAH